jgi:uncharacterized Zn finger protein
MSKYFWDNKEHKCPTCGDDLSYLTSVLTENLQQQSFVCKNENCGKIFDINYKLVVDSIIEYKEYLEK